MDMDMDIDSDLEAQFVPNEIEAIMHLHSRQRWLLIFLTIILAWIAVIANQLFSPAPHIPYHTSILTGHG